MRKLLLAALMLPLTLMAENYFVDGMEWYADRTYISYDPPYVPRSYIEHISIAGDTIVDDVPALKVYATDPLGNVGLEAVIRTEGDKVYTLSNYESNEWYLAYDFSLKPGEDCYIARFDAINKREKPRLDHIVCIGNVPNEKYGGYPALQFEPETYYGVLDEHYQGEWLIGVGNKAGVSLNYFNTGLQGGGGRLLSASINGTEICQYVSDKISDTEVSDSSMLITQTGDRSISITNIAPNSQVYVFNTAGAMVFTRTATEGCLNVNFEHKGIYIVKTGAAAKIVSLR